MIECSVCGTCAPFVIKTPFEYVTGAREMLCEHTEEEAGYCINCIIQCFIEDELVEEHGCGFSLHTEG